MGFMFSRTNFFTFPRAGTLCFSSIREEIQNYDKKKDEEEVVKISRDFLHVLTSNYFFFIGRKEEYDESVVRKEIIPFFESSNIQKKVLRVDGKTIGFITYHLKRESIFGKTATIFHLAIDSNFQNNRYGSALLQAAIKDLEQEQTTLVELQIVSSDLIPFYQKHNFQLIAEPNPLSHQGAGKMALPLNTDSLAQSSKVLRKIYMHRPGVPLIGWVYLAIFAAGVAYTRLA